MTPTLRRIAIAVGGFLAITVVFGALPASAAAVLLPLVLITVFVIAAVKAQPVAIALLLFYAMTLGSWLILAAAPGVVLLARRYQRHRLLLDLNPDHIRRTSLFGVAALVATLPFMHAAFGPWSSRGSSSSFDSARPLIEQTRPGEESALQRFARWLGFGPDGTEFAEDGPLVPRPRLVPEPDDGFNWWILVAILVLLALAALAWWLWRRRTPKAVPVELPTAAEPLARLEAIGASLGRPRRVEEGAIAYGQALAAYTNDPRLANVGPLVSGQVYESRWVDPGSVRDGLQGIEAAPPDAPPQPSRWQRISERASSVRLTVGGILLASFAVVALIITALILIPRLGDLEENAAVLGLQQASIAPLVAEHLNDLFI